MKLNMGLFKYSRHCSTTFSNISVEMLRKDISKVFSTLSHYQTKCEGNAKIHPASIPSFTLKLYNGRATTILRNGLESNSIGCKLLGTLLNTRSFITSASLHLQNEQKTTKGKSDTVNIGGGTWKEVYSGVLTTQLKLLKMFSIGSSVIGLSMQPILYEKLGTVNLTVVVSLATFLGFFTFVTPALIHWVSKKYVTKLEYDPSNDVYAATTLSFFLREKKIHFTIDDVTRPDVPGLFTSFLVKNQALFVDPETFEDLDHYTRIMGYDKPIDFTWEKDKKPR